MLQLQRQMAYDRLLERLYLLDEDWIINGATALLARDIGVRGTIDIDLYHDVAREISDKACAIFERHGPTGTVLTRYRDLVDLVAIVLAEYLPCGCPFGWGSRVTARR